MVERSVRREPFQELACKEGEGPNGGDFGEMRPLWGSRRSCAVLRLDGDLVLAETATGGGGQLSPDLRGLALDARKGVRLLGPKSIDGPPPCEVPSWDTPPRKEGLNGGETNDR